MKNLKGKGKAKSTVNVSAGPSANWLALKNTIVKSPRAHPNKKRKINTTSAQPTIQPNNSGIEPESVQKSISQPSTSQSKARDDVDSLNAMIQGKNIHSSVPSASTSQPDSTVKIGQYICIDCEMVGVGPPTTDKRTGKIVTESSLARVSIVNYHGELLLDVFVKQKEKVTDYRTAVSGVRPADLVGPSAMSFEEVQRKVADLLKGRILVGHAVQNDLKVLMLKHSASDTRDTQKNEAIRAAYRTKKPGLRTVIKKEFDLDIQSGEHSSVIDARATMALYRLYRNQPNPPKSEGKAYQSSKPPRHSLQGNNKNLVDMPFMESKTLPPQVESWDANQGNDEGDAMTDWQDVDSSDNENGDERHENASIVTSARLQKAVQSDSSKKRKRNPDQLPEGMDVDPLILHIASSKHLAPSLFSVPSPPHPPKSSSHRAKAQSKPQSTKGGRDTNATFPGGGIKGISSGVATVVRVKGKPTKVLGKGGTRMRSATIDGSGRSKSGENWWSTL